MKKIVCSLAIALVALSCKTGQTATVEQTKPEVNVTIDLVNVADDKVKVSVMPTATKESEVIFSIPKTVPGTYSTDNYGKFIENVKAFDKNGAALPIAKIDENSYKISNATQLAKVTYLVNDSYDTEKKGGMGGGDVFSPAGTNIDPNCYMVNTHGFVGYFSDKKDAPYNLTIQHEAKLQGATAMVDVDASPTVDTFKTTRYAELVDHPIMYSKPDITTFKVDDMEIVISVYSPTGKFTAAGLTPNMETMMRAQKKFLGNVNATKKYAILIYLSDMSKNDAKGFGALEHTTSTTVVMPEMMPQDQMAEQLKDIVSHEFFHIVTPLTVHSNEIHYFDFNAPKMSKHLWMYEGVTEYFANLFQVNQGLITEEEFYGRMADKIAQAKAMNDTMPFTKMSAEVLQAPYKDQYLNVYQKGALIGMCVDIIIREKSNGQRGILDLMQKLSNEYGSAKPFNDDELFAKIVSLTYPEVGSFLETYVSGPTPIPYDEFFAKMGVTNATQKVPGNLFLKGQTPFVNIKKETKEIYLMPGIELPEFYNKIGMKGGDIITEVNDKKYNLDNIYDLIMASQTWKENDPISLKFKRDNVEKSVKGNIKLPFEDVAGFSATNADKKAVKEAWLKG